MFQVKKCDYAKEHILARFNKLQKAIRFIGMYDPEGMLPLIIFDSTTCEVVTWTDAATRHTLSYLKQYNKAFEKVPWKKEGF